MMRRVCDLAPECGHPDGFTCPLCADPLPIEVADGPARESVQDRYWADHFVLTAVEVKTAPDQLPMF